jgi:hypothetical protein
MKMPDPGNETEQKKRGCALASLAYSITGDQLVVRQEAIATEFSRQFKPGSQGESR